MSSKRQPLEHPIVKHPDFMKASCIQRTPPKFGVKLKRQFEGSKRHYHTGAGYWVYGDTMKEACDRALTSFVVAKLRQSA